MFDLTKVLEGCSSEIMRRVPHEEYECFLESVQRCTGNMCISTVITALTSAELALVHAAAAFPQNNGGEYISVAQAAQQLGVSAPAVSRTLKKLESRGYIERNIDPADRRSVRISVTSAGIEAMSQCITESAEMINLTLEDFTDDEIRTMIRLHCKFSKKMAEVISEKKAIKKGAKNNA